MYISYELVHRGKVCQKPADDDGFLVNTARFPPSVMVAVDV